MPDFPRLPSHLRVVSLLGLLCLLAFSVLFAHLFNTILSSFSMDSWRMLMVAVNLFILGWTCLTVVRIYHARSPQPHRAPFPLSSWQRQVWAIVSWTALPFCALALAAFIPPTAPAYGLVFPASMLACGVLIAARSVVKESSGPQRATGT